VHTVTILPRGRALGYTMVLPDQDKYSNTRSELLDQLAYMMGGRAAEELVFHDPTTGASNDIEKATATARAMVTQYGMSERLGAVKFGQESGEVFMGKDMGHGRDYSEEVAAQVDSEVRALVENAHHEAWEILVEYRDVLDDMVLKLLDKETLNKEEVLEIFAPVAKRPSRQHPTGNGRRPLSTRPPVLTPAELAVMGPADLAELEDLARGRTPAGAPAKPTSRRRAPAADAPSRSRTTVNRAANAARKATGTARAAQPPSAPPQAPATAPDPRPQAGPTGPAPSARAAQPPARRPRRATGTDPAS
jgi:cell division protease FtsH